MRIESLLRAGCALLLASLLAPGAAWPQTRNRAEGFDALPKNARLVVMPIDIELFSISGGGVLEPKADWTDAASKHLKAALDAKEKSLDVTAVELSEKDADEFDEINALHGAIARSIALHHFGPSMYRLPTKDGKLDWSMGEPVRAIRDRTGADYALFTWIRDSYASTERQIANVAIAILSLGRVIPLGGVQSGYASLVDLTTGRVLWFNALARISGDLREAGKAGETLDKLLENFPDSK